MKKNEKSFLGTQRLETLVDGIYAIVMTLLVFDLKIPEITSGDIHAQLISKLIQLLPNLFIYFFSFIMLGIYWVGHHNVAKFVKYSDRTLLWLNLGYLALVGLIPFTTSLLSHYYMEQSGYIIYGLNLFFIGLFSYLQWDYATTHHRLVDHSIPDSFVYSVKKRIIVAPVLCVVAIIFLFLNTNLSLLTYMVIPLYYVVPNAVDSYWSRPAEPHDH